jgi:hypothetical protein
MTPKGARTLASVLIALLLGWAWSIWKTQQVESDLKDEAAQQAAQVAELRQSIRALQAAAAQRASAARPVADPVAPTADEPALGALPGDRTARNRALLGLLRGGELGLLSYAAPSVYKVSTKIDKLAEVLGLTANESATLQAAANNVLNTLLAGAQVRRGASEIVIEMEDSPQARAELGRMRETFQQVLGEDGHAIYDSLGFKAALENSLSNVGLVPYTVTVSKGVNPTTGAPTYVMNRQGTAAAGQSISYVNGVATRAPAVAPVTDEEAASVIATRQREYAQNQARLEAARAAGRGGVVGTGQTLTSRTNLSSALGPLEIFIPADF